MNDLDEHLAHRLHDLGARIDAMPTDITADLHRGAAARRRQRVARGLGAGVFSLMLVGGVVGAYQMVSSPTAAPRPAEAASVSPSASTSSAAAVPDGDREIKVLSEKEVQAQFVKSHAEIDRSSGPERDLLEPVRRAFATVLTEHLDPGRQHIKTTGDGLSRGGSTHVVSSVSDIFDWKVKGWAEPAQLKVSVSAGWSGTDFPCKRDRIWACRTVTPPAHATEAVVATYPGGTAVAVQRTDGDVVAIFARPSYDEMPGESDGTPSIRVTTKALLAAAADPRITLPKPVSVAPELPSDEFVDVAAKTLVGSGETWVKKVSGNGGSAVRDRGINEQRGELWRAGKDLGELNIDASRLFEPTDLAQICQVGFYTRCLTRTTGGRSVFIGYQTADLDHAVVVMYAGPGYQVTVRAPQGYPVDRAVAFVLDPRWQP